MQNQTDPLDDAMKSLGGRRWPGDYDNQELKEKIMNKFESNRNASPLRHKGPILALMTVMTLGCVGFAAAGGVDMVKGWFITVEINGVPVNTDTADIDVQTDGDTATVTVSNLDVEGDESGTAVVTVTASSDGTGHTVVESANGEVRTVTVIADDEGTDEDE